MRSSTGHRISFRYQRAISLTQLSKGNQMNKPLFELGQVVITPACIELIEHQGKSPEEFLARHHVGDWGDIDEEDKQMNEEALWGGSRLMSVYETERGNIWIFSEADRSSTTLLLPSEY
jgi:hypothetical protein